jgi:hypothetical protein
MLGSMPGLDAGLNTGIDLGLAAASTSINADALALRWIAWRITSGIAKETMATAGPTAPWPASLAEIIDGTAASIMVTRAPPSQSADRRLRGRGLQLATDIKPPIRHHWFPKNGNQNRLFLARPLRGLESNSCFFGPS